MFNNVFLTGDTHGSFIKIYEFCEKFNTTKDDLMIVAGDFGINYFLNNKEKKEKYKLNNLPITFLIVRGNHEIRPENISTYKEREWNGGVVYVEDDYPDLLFAKDGEVYNINNHKVLCIGGAYSVDKFYRISTGNKWFCDEQLTKEERDTIFRNVYGRAFDYVITHTCPLKYVPTEMFIPMVDQSTVDFSMEIWFNEIFGVIDFKRWYCGHYHTDKLDDKIRFLYNDFVDLGR